MCSVAIVLGRGPLNAGQNAMMYINLYTSVTQGQKKNLIRYFFFFSSFSGLWAQCSEVEIFLMFIVQVKQRFKCSRKTSLILAHPEALGTFRISEPILQASQGTVSANQGKCPTQ